MSRTILSPGVRREGAGDYIGRDYWSRDNAAGWTYRVSGALSFYLHRKPGVSALYRNDLLWLPLSTSTSKVLWLNQAMEWMRLDGESFLKKGAVTWMDDGKPWFVFTTEDVVYNVDVQEYIRAKGP